MSPRKNAHSGPRWFRYATGAAALALTFAASGAQGASDTFNVYGPGRSDVDAVTPTRVSTVVPIEGPIEDLDFGVSLQGGYADNLRLTLIHRGVSAVLYAGSGDSSAAYLDVLFDDEASSAYAPTGALEGNYRPAPGALSAFDGVELSGLWELRIENASGLLDDGTDLELFRLAGRVGLAGPPVVVALYDDPDFVDSADQSGGSEAENLYAALVGFGHDVRRFDGTSAARFAAALAGVEVLVIPELENGDLAALLDAAARKAIADFVAAGGRIVVSLGAPNTIGLVNAILGTSLVPGVGFGGPAGITTAARGTPFQGGPGSLPAAVQTTEFGQLPIDARVAYFANESQPAVVAIPFGAGTAFLLGWDFYRARPLGTNDGGWLEVLNRAVLGPRAVPARRVAVYDDGDFVDTASGDYEAESDTIQASLAALGHEVATFAGTSEARFRSALAGVSVLVVPELEIGLLADAMNPAARQLVADFVATGGVLVKPGGKSQAELDFLNTIFGFSLTLGTDFTGGEGVVSLEQGAVGTSFEGGPSELPLYSRTTPLAGLPPEGRVVYQAFDGQDVVVELPFGAGKVIWLGWDWYRAAPLGADDGVWLEVLHRAVLAAPEPGGTALGAAAFAALGLLRRGRRRRRPDDRWAPRASREALHAKPDLPV